MARRALLITFVVGAFAALCRPLPGLAAEPVAPLGFTSAEECGRCHEGLYRSWLTTFHSQAADNPAFQADLDAAEEEHGRSLRVFCLSCHSPTTALTMDFSLSGNLSLEGVTCDFCHTVSSVDLAAAGAKFKNDLSPVKAGPGRTDAPAAHRTRREPLLLQAEFCAGCHQLVNQAGLAIFDTYGEWKESPYRSEQRTCQTCHMPEVTSASVMLQGRKVDRPSHLHMEMGGHSQTQLATAATLTLDGSLKGNVLTVEATVENFKGGHKLPTGVPSRSVALKILILDTEGKIIDTRETAYERRLGDATGNALDDLADLWYRGAKVLADNRIAPKEKRRETFTFTLEAQHGTMIVDAVLSYRLKLPSLSPPYLYYEMASARKVVGSGLGGHSLGKGLAVALTVLILVFVTLILVRFRAGREEE